MKIENRRAYHDYDIQDRLEAGINLNGAEVKAVKMGHADLSGSFVRIVGSEAYLVNAKILPYRYAQPEGYDPNRTRKLLMHKKEILALKSRTDGAGLALVPLSLYTSKGLIKVEVAIGKGKKQYEKREAKKRKDLDRIVEQELASKP